MHLAVMNWRVHVGHAERHQPSLNANVSAGKSLLPLKVDVQGIVGWWPLSALLFDSFSSIVWCWSAIASEAVLLC